MLQETTTISIIITILNGAKWINSCFESIANQTAVQYCQNAQKQCPLFMSNASATTNNATNTTMPQVELCVFDDNSTDETFDILCKWRSSFEKLRIGFIIVRNTTGIAKGVGYGRNSAIAASSGSYFCFVDIDDEMMSDRILKQYEKANLHKNAIIGSKFIRIPSNSTCRFSRWANELDEEKLSLQIYTSNGPTVIMPTWFCHRIVYDNVSGGFCEDGYGIPEDLIFFYKHLECGGDIFRINECLLKYRYHPEATTFSVAAKTIRRIRLNHLITHVLQREPWSKGFTIWNAGKQGRKFFRDLPVIEKNKVFFFCDVDKNKICKYYKHFDEMERKVTHSIPIIHFSKALPPLVICMKLDLTNGVFEENLKSLNLTEGKDYILFT